MNSTEIFGMTGEKPTLHAKEMHPLQLAYIGDAIYELFVRYHLIQKGIRKTQELQKRAVLYVSAVAQAESCHRILPLLSTEEVEIVKKGRNAKSGHQPRSASVSQYRYSTGIEALFGYLYLEKKEKRIHELMKIIIESIDEVNQFE